MRYLILLLILFLPIGCDSKPEADSSVAVGEVPTGSSTSTSTPSVTNPAIIYKTVICTQAPDGTFIYVGTDFMIGASANSCEEAYRSWSYTLTQKQIDDLLPRRNIT